MDNKLNKSEASESISTWLGTTDESIPTQSFTNKSPESVEFTGKFCADGNQKLMNPEEVANSHQDYILCDKCGWTFGKSGFSLHRKNSKPGDPNAKNICNGCFLSYHR